MRFFKGLKFIVFIAVFCLVLGGVTEWLWNRLMPAIFGLHAISYWQAVGLLVLSKLLLGGFHRHGHHGGPGRFGRRRWDRDEKREWKRRMKERWCSMTPEDRDRFRTGMRDRWSHASPEERERFRHEMKQHWREASESFGDKMRDFAEGKPTPAEGASEEQR